MSKVHDLMCAIDYEHLLLEDYLNLNYQPQLKALIDQMGKTKQIRETLTGTEDWEEVAVYFGDCQAATAYTFGTTKSLSRYETGRHASICEAFADSLEYGALINKRSSDRERVIERLREAATVCRKKLEIKSKPEKKSLMALKAEKRSRNYADLSPEE